MTKNEKFRRMEAAIANLERWTVQADRVIAAMSRALLDSLKSEEETDGPIETDSSGE